MQINNKEITDAVKEALGKAFKSWLDANRADLIRALAASAQVTPPKEKEPKPERLQSADQLYLTTHELAERWSFNPESIRRIVREGRLTVTRIGHRVLIPLAEIKKHEVDCTQERSTDVA